MSPAHSFLSLACYTFIDMTNYLDTGVMSLMIIVFLIIINSLIPIIIVYRGP